MAVTNSQSTPKARVLSTTRPPTADAIRDFVADRDLFAFLAFR